MRVCDRGPGVPAEMRERIFEPFFRLPGHAEQRRRRRPRPVARQADRRAPRRQRALRPRDGGGSCFVLSAAGGLTARLGALAVAAPSRRKPRRAPDAGRRASAGGRRDPEARAPCSDGRRRRRAVERDDVAAAEADAPDRDRVDHQRHGGDAVARAARRRRSSAPRRRRGTAPPRPAAAAPRRRSPGRACRARTSGSRSEVDRARRAPPRSATPISQAVPAEPPRVARVAGADALRDQRAGGVGQRQRQHEHQRRPGWPRSGGRPPASRRAAR